MEEESSGGLLFDNVVFTILQETSGLVNSGDIVDALESAGARHLNVPLHDCDKHIDGLDNLTHIISSHVDFPQYNRTLELGIPVVKPKWVIDSIVKKKQAATRQYSPDPSQFFHDVVVTCGDIPEGDGEAIFAGVIALGGQFMEKMSKQVTHVVTTSMEHPKVSLVWEKDLDCKIVLPHWFDDCFRLGKKINERPYMYPDPEYLRRENANVQPRASPHIRGAISASPPELGLPNPLPSPSKNRKDLNVFMSKKIYISDDLSLSDHVLDMLRRLIDYGGGVVTKKLDEADIYIGQWRQGPDYVAASHAGKEVASLAWLYHVINRNRYSSPLRKLFHYPLPRDGVEGFKDFKISLSNYSGDARTYVENLIRACGATYTRTMKQDNTHLITAHMHGEKCDAAQEWGLRIVNHLWLEESYAKCAIQAMSNQRYTHFPTRTNLGEVTGQTNLDMVEVSRIHFPTPRSSQKHRVASRHSPRKNVPASSVAANGSTLPDESNIDVPLTIPEAAGTEADHGASEEEEQEGEDDNDEETEDEEDEVSQTAKKPRGRPPKSALATPRRIEEEKENATPLMTSTGRAAKAKANEKNRAAASDIALFQKEMKRKGGVTHGGRRSSLAEEASPAPQRASKKRPSDEYDATALDSDLSDGETQGPAPKGAKRAKRMDSPALPPIIHRMMVTGDDRWQNNAKKESADKTTLRNLGVLLTQDPCHVTILVAPKLLRTRKFVCALACAPLVVDTSFLDTALKKNKLVEEPPMLKDPDGEERLGFTLSDALERAMKNQKKLFRGWTIFVTEDVKGGYDTYKDIITLNGGSPMLFKGRAGSMGSKMPRDDQHTGDEIDSVYLVSGTTEKEIKLWKTFRENVTKQDLQCRIVTTDWVLNAAMSQKVTFDEAWELDEQKARDMNQRGR